MRFFDRFANRRERRARVVHLHRRCRDVEADLADHAVRFPLGRLAGGVARAHEAVVVPAMAAALAAAEARHVLQHFRMMRREEICGTHGLGRPRGIAQNYPARAADRERLERRSASAWAVVTMSPATRPLPGRQALRSPRSLDDEHDAVSITHATASTDVAAFDRFDHDRILPSRPVPTVSWTALAVHLPVMFTTRVFDGQTAVVTGGGTGIGLAIARTLGRARRADRDREPRARIISTPRRRSFTPNGCEAIGVPVDVRDPAAVDAMVARAIEAFGSIDILVNNAAGNFVCHAEDLSPNGWNAVIGIVLNGSFYCSRAVGRHMIERGAGGSIVSILANYAWTGSAGTIHSASAKAGVHGDDADAGRRMGEAPHSRECRRAGSDRVARRRAPALGD